MQNLSLVSDAKFESGISSSSGDMTSQNFPRKNPGNESSNSAIYSRKTGLTLKNESRIVPLDPKLTHPCQFQQFPSRRKLFHFLNFWDVSMTKEQQQPPD